MTIILFVKYYIVNSHFEWETMGKVEIKGRVYVRKRSTLTLIRIFLDWSIVNNV